MARRERTHLTGDATTAGLPMKHLTRAEFGQRLSRAMLNKGWRQSELARQSGLSRDSVSTYILGKTLPSQINLKKLADALGLTEEVLLPNHTEFAIAEDPPSFEMKASINDPKLMWVRVNRLVSMTTAVAIANLLNDEDAVNRD